MQIIQKLADLFARFPGIGRRQSKRFVFFLLGQEQEWLTALADAIKNLKTSIAECAECHRYFESGAGAVCELCADAHRDATTLLIVEKDVNLEAIEKSRAYTGRYFVLGGTVPILEKEPDKHIRLHDIKKLIVQRLKDGLAEIIIATSLNPEGENTALFLQKEITPLVAAHKVKISFLGRGLSTGTEIEYSDTETIKSALSNRR